MSGPTARPGGAAARAMSARGGGRPWPLGAAGARADRASWPSRSPARSRRRCRRSRASSCPRRASGWTVPASSGWRSSASAARRRSTGCCARTPTRASRPPTEDPVKLIVSAGPGQGARAVGAQHPAGAGHHASWRRQDLKVTADQQASDTVEEGFAIGTSPREGTEVERGSRVRLFVSSGPGQDRGPGRGGPHPRGGRDAPDARGLRPDVADAGVRRARGRGDRPVARRPARSSTTARA